MKFKALNASPVQLRWTLEKEIIMNALKSVFAIAVMAISATVSAQVVYTPDFPVKKEAPVQASNPGTQAPVSEASGLNQAASEKVA